MSKHFTPGLKAGVGATMKIEALISLLFVAAACVLVEVNGSNEAGECPHDFFKKHPEYREKKMELMKKYGMPDISRLPSCSENEKCADGRICCKSPCGMKCMRPVNENNANEVLDLMRKDLYPEDALQPYVETEDDRRLGMCPENYVRTHPELQEKLMNKWKNKNQHKCGEKCKEGEQCPMKNKDKPPKHFQNLASMPDCTTDKDCKDQTRCCRTMCGKKCRKPVKTEEEFMKSMFGNRKEKRQE